MVSNKGFHCVIGDPSVLKEETRFCEEEERCKLDPGGLLHLKIPWHEFEVQGVKFAIQLHNAEFFGRNMREKQSGNLYGDDLVAFFSGGKEFIIPKGVHDELLTTLKQLSKSTEAAHMEMDADDNVRHLEENIDFISTKNKSVAEINAALNKPAGE
tara:strand:- start:2727 stop:3194 length:468 start_codon:yes stop_codon:yes gene_type:complete